MNIEILKNEVNIAIQKLHQNEQHRKQMEEKLENLKKEIQKTEEADKKALRRVTLVGQKTEDPAKPGTPENQASKRKSNTNLYQLKLQVIKESFPEDYARFESVMPTMLKESNVPLN